MWKLALDFGKLNPEGEPIYLQIMRRFKLLVLKGKLQDGGEVPSRRKLAASLGVNPNTVQKAFAELEREGLIVTPPNAKSVVRVSKNDFNRIQHELLEGQVIALAETAKEAGLDLGQLIKLIKKVANETFSDTVET